MKPFVLLIKKDLLRRWRSPGSTIVMLVFPIVMSLMIGLTFGGESGNDSFSRIRVLFVDRDQSFLSGAILSFLTSEQAQERFEVVAVEPEEGERMMEAGKASALIEIPENFTEDVFSVEPTYIRVVRNPAESILPEIVEIGAEVITTYLSLGGRLLAEPYAELRRILDEADDEVPSSEAVSALAALAVTQIDYAKPFLFPPVVELAGEKDETITGPDVDIFSFLLPMIGVMAILFISNVVMKDLHWERAGLTLARLRTTPVSLGTILWSKVGNSVLVCLGSIFLLALFGTLTRWFRDPVDPAALVLHSFALALGCSGLAALIQGLTRTQRQADGLFWIVAMGMSMTGGSFFPLDQMPAAVQRIAPFTVNYWGIRGFESLVLGEPGSDVLRASAVLLGIGVVTAMAGVFLFGRRFREGPA